MPFLCSLVMQGRETMGRFWTPLITAAVVAAAAAAVPADRGKVRPAGRVIRQELEKLSGTFEVVLFEQDGKRFAAAELRKMKVVQNGARWRFYVGEEVTEGIDQFDPGKTPRAVDATYTSGALKGKKVLGIYEIDEETVRFCYAEAGKGRPREFATTAGSGLTLFVLKRLRGSE
jgi:uncharacterized protein (TIGR03067 family)